jgi:hypothetical protein
MNVDENGTHIGRPMLPLLVQNDPHGIYQAFDTCQAHQLRPEAETYGPS